MYEILCQCEDRVYQLLNPFTEWRTTTAGLYAEPTGRLIGFHFSTSKCQNGCLFIPLQMAIESLTSSVALNWRLQYLRGVCYNSSSRRMTPPSDNDEVRPKWSSGIVALDFFPFRHWVLDITLGCAAKGVQLFQLFRSKTASLKHCNNCCAWQSFHNAWPPNALCKIYWKTLPLLVMCVHAWTTPVCSTECSQSDLEIVILS